MAADDREVFVLGAMMAGLSLVSVGYEELAAEEIVKDGPKAVATTIVLPSGERFRVRVEQLESES